MTAEDFIAIIKAIEPLLSVMLGAFISFIAAAIIWHRTTKKERIEKRLDELLRCLELAYSLLEYARRLAYLKLEPVTSAYKLPENPMHKLLALANLHVREAVPVTQPLHDLMEQIESLHVEQELEATELFGTLELLTKRVNNFAEFIRQLAIDEKLIHADKRIARKYNRIAQSLDLPPIDRSEQ